MQQIMGLWSAKWKEWYAIIGKVMRMSQMKTLNIYTVNNIHF